MSNTTISKDLARQRKYAKSKEAEGFDFGLTVADAFVRGIRDIGYRDTGRALDELIDNGIQAEASKILVTFGFDKTSDAKPASIAVVDNGHGMDPEMLRLAVIWGGTHRENDRTGFGRYGYGLPSACVSQGQAFTVFSLVEGGEMTAITLDLEEIGDGQYTDDNGRIVVPPAGPAKLPKWLAKTIRDQLGIDQFEHGTVVLIEKLDRLTWKTRNALERHLLQGIGVTYRNFLRHTGIWVDDKRVEPVDPLFTTPGYRFYDLDEDRAEALEDHSFEVKDPDTRRPIGTVKVRYSSMPPTFARVDKNVERGKNNARFEIIADHNGIIVMREGRQIDVVSQRPWLSVNNDDRYWGCEIDLPATLDEEMSITTSKQRVILSDRVWALLKEQGVLANIIALRKRYDDEKAKAKVKREKRAGAQVAGQAMGAAEKFRTDKAPETPERRQKSQQALEREVDRRAEGSGVDRDAVKSQVEQEVQETPYKIAEESLKGAPFFRVDQVGPQKVLYLNTAHRFYRDIYAGQESTPRLRAAIQIVLFTFGVGEIDAEGDRLLFFETERGAWSTRLEAALAQFERFDAADEVREAGEDEATPD
ncbi:MAG: ATP-binding protein [Thermoleophilia bacterium]|nr:ATP-binding protein [Thermoleophilia bacterium]